MTALRDDAVGFLCRQDDGMTACIMQVLRTAVALAPARRRAAGFDTVAIDCRRRLEARLARPERAGDDWSIDLIPACDCDLCDVLGAFMRDPGRFFEWPLAKEKRRHVHNRIDGAELPVRHETRRKGSPYILVLTKTDALFERDRQARRRDGVDLGWLEGGWSIGAPRSRR